MNKWYMEHIEFDDNDKPYIKDVGLEVHKITDKIKDDYYPQQVVNDYHNIHNYLFNIEKGNVDSDIDVESTEGFEAPELTIEHVEAAIDFERDNKELVNNISKEEEELFNIFLLPLDAIESRLSETEFEYYNVNFNKYKQDGEVHFDFNYE